MLPWAVGGVLRAAGGVLRAFFNKCWAVQGVLCMGDVIFLCAVGWVLRSVGGVIRSVGGMFRSEWCSGL